jgi:hypothetical protein
VHFHAALIGLAQGFARDRFEQFDQAFAVFQVFEEVLDAHAEFVQKGVAPLCEGLLLDVDALLLERADAALLKVFHLIDVVRVSWIFKISHNIMQLLCNS